MKKYFTLAFIFVVPYCLWSQAMRTVTFREEAKEIVIGENGIQASAKDIFDTTVVDDQKNGIAYNYADEVKTFWYKIFVNEDSKIAFEIYPTSPGNRYNFFLYQNQGDFSIEEIKSMNIIPVRANLYMDEIEKGTGLSLASNVSSNDTAKQDLIKTWYHTPYQSALTACAGDVLLLNIYHVDGGDCGQHFVLQADKLTQEFQSMYQTCHNEGFVMKKIVPGEEMASVKKSKDVDSTLLSKPVCSFGTTTCETKHGSGSDNDQLTASLNSNPEVKKHKRVKESKIATVSEKDKVKAGLVTAGIFSINNRKTPPSTEKKTSEYYSPRTGFIVLGSIAGFGLLFLLFIIFGRKRHKEHSDRIKLAGH